MLVMRKSLFGWAPSGFGCALTFYHTQRMQLGLKGSNGNRESSKHMHYYRFILKLNGVNIQTMQRILKQN